MSKTVQGRKRGTQQSVKKKKEAEKQTHYRCN